MSALISAADSVSIAVPSGRCRKLVVFFSRGMSFEGWHRAGILDRELALYREISTVVDRLVFVTYGGVGDLQWTSRLPNMEVLPNSWGLGSNLYSVLAPWLHRKSVRDASVLKTNQINGAWCGVVAKVLFRKTLIVRCGFLWGDFVARMGGSRVRRIITRAVERMVMRSADRIVVACTADAAAIERYGIDPSRITIIPNYVDTDRFRPLPGVTAERGRLAFVGRLDAQKNVEALVDALVGLPDLTLTIVGEGPLQSALEERASRCGVRVEFVGRVEHSTLPRLLNRSELFVLPSWYEGNPKALVEAMACGVPVIGAATPGIREILVHRETGYLCGTSSSEIRAAILDVLSDASLRSRLRDGGLRYVREQCSLSIAADRERALLGSLARVN